MKLVLATNNPGKIKEFKRILAPLNVEVVTPKELGIVMEAEETGETFKANAKIKAEELFLKTGLPTVADDSGLAIDALGGRPGVATARYGGEELGYAEKFGLIFNELEGTPPEKRTAAFVCSIYCKLSETDYIHCEQRCEGIIGTKPQGEDGFGYDPIFYVGDRSFSQLSPQEKDEISHRGKALREFGQLLKDCKFSEVENHK